MPDNNQLDTILLDPIQLPYNNILTELDTTPRLVTGSQNTLIDFGGALINRGGTRTLANGSISGGQIQRMWAYETLEASPRTYILASVKVSSVWTMYYNAVDAGVLTGWTQMAALGDIRVSTRPHEVVVVRGRAYIKGFPSGSNADKLGLYQFYATGGTPVLTYWGMLGPTKPAQIYGCGLLLDGAINEYQTAIVVTSTQLTINGSSIGMPSAPFVVQCDYEQLYVTTVAGNNWTVTRGYNGTIADSHANNTAVIWRNWSASGHNVSTQFGWKYSYCWKNLAGHYSNRAPLVTNIEHMPSATGPFEKLVPKVKIPDVPSDTTNYPSILILRTTDGGGLFYPLTEVDNPGSAFDFEDKYFPTGASLASNITYDGPIYNRSLSAGNFVDPVEDEFLIDERIGPGLDTNSPLPTVATPKVVGVDAPTPSTSIVHHAGRIWVATENVLFYTSAEELPYGIPEEAADTSSSGNFFRFQDNIAQIFSLGINLYVCTVAGRVLEVNGVSKETFNVQPRLESVGAPAGHPHAICRAGDKLFLLSRDYHIYMIDENSERIISHPLNSELKSAVEAGREIQMAYFTELDKNWLVVSACDRTTPANSRTWVCDMWKTQRLSRNYSENLERTSQRIPEYTYDFWNAPWTINSTAQVVARYTRAHNAQRLYFAVYSGTTSQLVYYDPTYLYDDLPSGNGNKYDWNATTSLMSTPPGNLINQLREPGTHPSGYCITLERSQTTNDMDPHIAVFIDDLWQCAELTKVETDQYIKDSKGFRILKAYVNNIGRYFAAQLKHDRLTYGLKYHKLGITFQPTWTPN
jgi:hypothetical protein